MQRFAIGNLNKTEWEIMKICWEKGVATVKTVYEESQKIKERRYTTIKTMLDRLVEKKYLTREKFGPVWLYKPTVTEKKATSDALSDFMQVVTNNNTTPIIKHVLNTKRYDIDIELLKKLVDELESGE